MGQNINIVSLVIVVRPLIQMNEDMFVNPWDFVMNLRLLNFTLFQHTNTHELV